MSDRERVTSYIGLGSNLEDRVGNIRGAIDRMRVHKRIDVVAVSSFYETSPLQLVDQPNFINAVAQIETALGASELLSVLQGIEDGMGRSRVKRYGPRVIDLDILLFGDEVIDEPGLKIPHEKMDIRRFVLVPLCEIAPGAIHPVLEISAQELLNRVEAQGECFKIE